MNHSEFRHLPSVHRVLEHRTLVDLRSHHSHEVILAAVREEIERIRQLLLQGEETDLARDLDAIAQRVMERLQKEGVPRFRRVINATGIVIHTNLGRAPLSEEAARSAYDAARAYLNLEMNLADGKRSSRQDPLREVLVWLTGAESATAVNNNAAATVIVLRSLAAGKEVVVSRGQLIEIGGSFRIPEIMGVSGAILREVGTTNITRIQDYERAIGPQTGALLRVHPSNYRIRGFTEETPLQELVSLGSRYHLPVIDDVGSGALFDFADWGMPDEPWVTESIRTGADLVLFSGDKLLGGPQAGLIVGKKHWIERIEKDPLMRAFRLDKMTLAALEATLRLYRHPERALREIPVLRMLRETPEELRSRAHVLAEKLQSTPGIAEVQVRSELAYSGGGSLPDLPLPSVAIAMTSTLIDDVTFAERLRMGRPAVMARLDDGKVILDLRTVFKEDEEDLLNAIRAVLN